MLVNSLAHGVVTLALGNLFSAEERRIQNTIERLNKLHNEASGKPSDGFLINGYAFRSKATTGPVIGVVASLHDSLDDQAQRFMRDDKQLKLDKQLIRQALVRVVEPCEDLQDLRDALPNCLRDCLDQAVTRMSRTRPEAYTIQDNPRALRDYLKILPRIEFYSASRLLY